MGVFDFLFRRNNDNSSLHETQIADRQTDKREDPGVDSSDSFLTYDDKNITFSGVQQNYDYDSILRNKQANINRFYELADYYVDADPIFRGIVKGVYVPFTMSEKWRLTGVNEKTKKKYEEYYERIHLNDRMQSIFYQYYKYANVFVYLMPDGNLITLPPHRVRIGNVMVNGEPIVEFDVKGIRDELRVRGDTAIQNYVEDEKIEVRIEGVPPEVSDALNGAANWVQLNPDNTYVLQDIKEDWTRYAIPMISSALSALKKKEAITRYDVSWLGLGARAFLHTKYGDANAGRDFTPNVNELNKVQSLFKKAMTGTGIATTNPWADAKFVQLDMREFFDVDHNKHVNSEILASGGISGIVVSGQADDGSTFASAQVSVQTVALRIKRAQDNFCEMMNKINRRLNEGNGGMTHSAPDQVPKFAFPPVDLTNSTKLQDTCYKLWQTGVMSNQTMLDVHGYDVDQEVELIKKEKGKGMIRPSVEKEQETGVIDKPIPKERGRPRMDESDRTSDESKSETGRAPKPSNPEGSM